jgi:Xaa-Pro aminopeptidase
MNGYFIPKPEITDRIRKLGQAAARAGLDGVFITEGVQLLYYTGSIQTGVLFVPARGEPLYFVRRSGARARAESPVRDQAPFQSFRDIRAFLSKRGCAFSRIGLEMDAVTLTAFNLLKKHFPETAFSDVSLALKKIRATKSPYEVQKLRRAGEIGREICQKIPERLVPGITEWELGLWLFQEVAALSRNAVYRTAFGSGEFFLGNVCFGDTSIHPAVFDGPGGIAGKSPVSPYGGSDRRLEKGQLVFIDLIYPFEEYYVDKTRLFSLGPPSAAVREAHAVCLEIQAEVQKRLKPGALPSDIYEAVYTRVVDPKDFQEHFMGFGGNQVRFLGHGIGMTINEYPVIARKFTDPLEENMVIAVEPKKGMAGIGMAGIENTFLVTRSGGENLTADRDDIIVL